MILTHSVKVCHAPLRPAQKFRHAQRVGRGGAARGPALLQALRLPQPEVRPGEAPLLGRERAVGHGLEKGRFNRPKAGDRRAAKLHLKPEALEMLLCGVDLKDGMRRAWYEGP